MVGQALVHIPQRPFRTASSRRSRTPIGPSAKGSSAGVPSRAGSARLSVEPRAAPLRPSAPVTGYCCPRHPSVTAAQLWLGNQYANQCNAVEALAVLIWSLVGLRDERQHLVRPSSWSADAR